MVLFERMDVYTDRNCFIFLLKQKLPVLRFKNLENDAIQRIRNLPTGKPLALYIFTEDSKIAEMVTRRTTSGGLCVNDALMHIANADLPFGV